MNYARSSGYNYTSTSQGGYPEVQTSKRHVGALSPWADCVGREREIVLHTNSRSHGARVHVYMRDVTIKEGSGGVRHFCDDGFRSAIFGTCPSKRLRSHCPAADTDRTCTAQFHGAIGNDGFLTEWDSGGAWLQRHPK